VRDIIARELGPAEKHFVTGRGAFEAEFSSLFSRDKTGAGRRLTGYVTSAFKEVDRLYDAVLKKFPGTS
jgi:hypothetical protein